MTKKHLQRRWRSLLLPTVIAIASATAIAGCGSGGGGSSSAEAPAGKTITIGLVWSLSGEFAPYGEPGVDGVKLAAEEVNKAGGIKMGGKTYKLAVKVLDDRSNPQTAVADANQFIRDDGIKYIAGPISTLAASVMKQAATAKVLQLNAASIANELAGSSEYPYLFATLPGPTQRVEATIDAIKTFLPSVKRIAVVGPDEATGQALFPVFEEVAKTEALELKTFPYPPTTTDLSTTMTKVAADDPEVIVAGFSGPDAEKIFPVLESSGIGKNVTLALWGASYEAGIKGLPGRSFIADPMIGGDFTVPHPSTGATNFKAKLAAFVAPKQLTPFATGAELLYDGVVQLGAAFNAAKTSNPNDVAAVAEAMNTVTSQGANGVVHFSKNNPLTGLDVTYVSANHKTVISKHFTPAGG
ncbi:MAG TPA: ABC transporter substrate-binding protein [Solirubrobacteraceae bacterium]|jgi:ABC-type branched-subunit amino acid transport system substrate-binding protein